MAQALRRLVPNTLTMLNLTSGVLATFFALAGIWHGGNLELYAVGLILLGAFFDLFDGMSARLLHCPSPLGIQLDSLADLVTFGMAPAAIYTQILGRRLSLGWMTGFTPELLQLAAPLVLVGASAYRLAIFNTDTRQTTHFLGLPTPASALMTIGFALALRYGDPASIAGRITCCGWKLPLIIVLQSALLVSDIPMFSLKFKRLSLRALAPVAILAAIWSITLALLKADGLAFLILEYILVSILTVRLWATDSEKEAQSQGAGKEE